MSVAQLEITRRTPFAHDYERIDGLLHFAVDPAHPANSRIADLDRAPRDAAGQVRFSSDFVLLQPADRAQRRSPPAVLRRQSRAARRRALQPLRAAPARRCRRRTRSIRAMGS